MKPCCICQHDPDWHFCGNVSRKRGAPHFLFTGCRHAEAFAKTTSFVDGLDRVAFEVKWDAEAERLFADYTKAWTEPQRVGFRVRVFKEDVAEELPLVASAEEIAAMKAWSNAHTADQYDEEPY